MFLNLNSIGNPTRLQISLPCKNMHFILTTMLNGSKFYFEFALQIQNLKISNSNIKALNNG